ncbi:hypothetical protein P3T76_010043 [Phytophthora citrophthora]|uniref:Calpain catalytic domain-containing protein n=1 Tax=Phytophthora citrophthora TaxID=4793 RepID=A0AAD9LH93_9STRA|nr:hypothetical protein P3T76_010043 [Phytophthora citrophthora]
MQEIHEKVTVFVTQRDLQKRSTEKDGAYASTTALQYVAENAGFDVVTFRVDFSQSASIKLHRPDPVSGTLQRSTLEMAFECELQPFERRVLAYLVRKRRKRAFVRVQYAVTAVVTPSVDTIVQAQERTAKTIDQQLQHSNRTFLDVSKWKLLPCRPTAEVAQACAEINRHFQQFGIGFIDPTFPPQAKALYDPDASNQLSDADAAVYGLCRWEHVRTVVDSSWIFVAPKTDQTKVELASRVSFTSGLPAQDSFLCALSIVAPYCKLWLPRWFPTLNAASQVERVMVVPVALCDRGLRWQQFLVDLFLPSFPLGRGIMTARNMHGELYASLLHKAYAKLKGNYAAITSISTMNILRELTGSPWVCLYDRTAEQVQLQEVVEASLSHGQSEDKGGSSTLVVVTFGNIDDHHRAFQVTIPSGKGSVILHDSSGEYLLKVMKANAAAFDWDQEDPSALRVSWEQLSALDPVVWSLSLGCRYEKRMRQISLHEGGTVMMTVAISIPSFTNITFSPSYSTRCESEGPQMDLDVSIAAVEPDFSMVDINVDDSLGILHNHDGVVSKQMARTLSAGEYVVTISAKHPGRSESHPDVSKVEEAEPESESEKTRAELTPTSTDTNLQLVFDCLDREGNHELSESDIINFLQVYEHVTPSERGEAALLSFLQQRGNSLTPGTNERRLSLEDFREIYLTQTLQDCKGETYTSASVRTRFQELIWQDVLRLLTRSRCDVEAESARSAIDCRYLVEMACSFHSDVPLLSVVVLSDDANNI